MNTVLFDMDGTIFDTEQISYDCWAKAIEDMHLPIDLEDLIEDMYGLNSHTFEIFFHNRFGVDFPARELTELRERYTVETIESGGLPLKPGVPRVFEELKALGCRMGLVSSTVCEVIERYLTLAGLEGVFDTIVGGDSVQKGKPEPFCYLLAAERLGVDAKDCIVVEDTKNGVLAGSRAGMRTVLIPDRQRPDAETLAHSTYQLSTLESLAELVRTIQEA